MTARDVLLSHGRLRVVDIGSGPVLVLLHGLGGTWRNWQANMSALAVHHRVIAVDLPGFGGSELYPGPVTVTRYVDTVVELLDRLGIDEATFVGNSMGGLLTIEMAVRHADRVRSAVLVCSGGIPLTTLQHRLVTIPQARAMNHLMRLRFSRWLVQRSQWVRIFLGARVFHDPGTIPPDLLAAALDGLSAPGFGPAADAAARYDARLSAPAITCPTLVLWGAEDPLLSVAIGREISRLIPGSDLEVWERTGHCPMLEHPARFNERVLSFVAQGQAPHPG